MRVMLAMAAAAAVMTVAAPAAAAILTNGNFEQPGGEQRTPLSSLTVPGWTYNNQGTGQDYYEADDMGDNLATQSGSHYLSFGHSSSYGGYVEQVFATTVGATYTLNYFVAEQQGDDAAQNLRALILNGATTLSADNDHLQQTFQAGASITFVAAAGSATVRFLDATPSSTGAYANLALDTVSVVGGGSGTAAPEPASWALMLVGFGGAGAMLRSGRGRRAKQPV